VYTLANIYISLNIFAGIKRMKNHYKRKIKLFSKIHLKDDSGLELSIFLIKNVLSINIYYRKLIN